MKYSIDYSHLPEPERAAKAVEDCREYLGEERFVILCELTRSYNPPISLDTFITVCSFVGIHGAPVEPLFNHINAGGK